MIVQVTSVLSADELSLLRAHLDRGAWDDGRLTAGFQSAQVKDNLQLSQSDPVAREASEAVLRALERNPLFVSATLPRYVYPPLFNRYGPGMSFGNHVDNAVRQLPGTSLRLRTDVSATLFLSAQEEYDGGELIIEDTYGAHSIKLPAGDMVVYPSSSLHRVLPVTRGVRCAAFFWVQSMVRADGDRALMFELDTAIRTLTERHTDRDSVMRLTNCYHNLLRRWAEL